MRALGLAHLYVSPASILKVKGIMHFFEYLSGIQLYSKPYSRYMVLCYSIQSFPSRVSQVF